jgi:enediyne biosynthesis protein E7
MKETSDQHTEGPPAVTAGVGALPPLAGDAFDVGSTPDSLERLAACAARYGDLFRIHAPGRRSDTWIVNNPADIKRVLVTSHRNYTKGVGLDRVALLLGNGIMTSEGETWRRQRRMIQPFFHRRVIEQFATLIEGCVAERLTRWQGLAARASPIDITEEMSALTLDIIVRSIFGSDLAWLAERMGGDPFALVTEHSARDLQFAYRFRALTRLVGELVAKRRAAGEEHADFLGMLMAARDKDSGEPMPDRELLDEAMTLVVAGHETSASALNWTWYLLATHPQAPRGRGRRAAGRAAPELPGHGAAALHAGGAAGGDAPVPARLDPEPAQHRGRHARRLHGAAAHRRHAEPVPDPAAPVALGSARGIPP